MHIPKHIRSALIAVAAVVLLAMPLVIAGKYERLGRQLEGMTPAQMKERGNRMVARELWDSALYCYQMLVEHTAGSKEPDERVLEAIAHNNMAYVYFYGRHDYSHAFQELLRSRELTLSVGDSAGLPYLDLNLANIYVLYGDERNAAENLRRAFLGALRGGDAEIAITSLDNLLMQALETGDTKDVMDDIRRFEARQFPAATPMLSYTRHLSEAVQALDKRDITQAAAAVQRAAESVDAKLTPDRYRYNCALVRAKLLQQGGRLEEALAAMQDIKIDSMPLDMQVGAYRTLSRIQKAAGGREASIESLLQSLSLQDSLYSKQGYSMIRDLRSDWETRRAAEELHASDQQRARAWRWAVGAGTASVLIALALLWILRLNRRLRASNRQLYRKAREQAALFGAHIGGTKPDAEAEESQAEEPVNPASASEEAEGPSAPEEERNGAGEGELVERIVRALGDAGAISDPDFSLARLAKMVGSNTKYVSHAINTRFGKNFPTVLGEARVAVACARLADDRQFGALSIEGIASETGFRSRSNFNAVFKRATGLTPSEYRKIAESEGRSQIKINLT